jgi:Sulfotransferase domain
MPIFQRLTRRRSPGTDTPPPPPPKAPGSGSGSADGNSHKEGKAPAAPAPARPEPPRNGPNSPGAAGAPGAAAKRKPAGRPAVQIPPGKTLDFVIIGAQRSGTTSLWQYLRTHPELWLPPDKEAPFFSHVERYERGIDRYLQQHFAAAPPRVKWGTASPHYMRGMPGSPVEAIAERMHATVPDAKLVAILRDPILRAFSQYRLTVRRGSETRSFADAARDLLQPEALEESRRDAVKINSYFVLGEYGRILGEFVGRYGRDQVFIGFTDDLERDPETFLREVLEHIGADPTHQPPDLGKKYYRGGTRRLIPEESQGELEAFLAKEIWPLIPAASLPDARRSFRFWFRLWNTLPDEEKAPEIDPATREALERHYAPDLARLTEVTGLKVPWSWAAR